MGLAEHDGPVKGGGPARPIYRVRSLAIEHSPAPR